MIQILKGSKKKKNNDGKETFFKLWHFHSLLIHFFFIALIIFCASLNDSNHNINTLCSRHKFNSS